MRLRKGCKPDVLNGKPSMNNELFNDCMSRKYYSGTKQYFCHVKTNV